MIKDNGDKSNTLVSIITVVLNDVTHLESTINSVLTQSILNIEYIIIDGGSTDGTIDILHKYENQLTRWISEPDKSLYDAMNKGTQLASGEWILYLNSGDRLNDINVLNRIFIDNKDAIQNKNAIYSDVIADYKTKQILRKARSIQLFWRGLPFSHQTCFIRTSISKARPFNLVYYNSADYDFLYSVFKEDKTKFYYFDSPIAIVDAINGISKNVKLSILYRDFLIINRKYSTSVQIFANYLILPFEYLYAMLRRFFKKK